MNWGSVPDWIVAATAIVAAGFGYRQLNAMQRADLRSAEAHEQAVEIERAAMLRAVDAEFESAEMYLSRKALRALRNRVQEKIGADHKEASEESITKLCAEEFSKQLTELWEIAKQLDAVDIDNNRSKEQVALDRYTEIMRYVNWLETIGYMCKRGLLPTEDILNIYDAAIIPSMLYVAEHIRKRREERPYPNAHFLEFALWLGEQALKHMKGKNTLPDPILANASLFED